MKLTEAQQLTNERRKQALEIAKNLSKLLDGFKIKENSSWGEAGSMGALLDKLIETETSFKNFLNNNQ